MNSQSAPTLNSLIGITRGVRELLADSFTQSVELSESAISFLKELAETEQRQVTQSEIASKLNLSESTLCTLIEKLRCDGIVVRERLQTDRRKTKLGLTEFGVEQLRKIEKIEQQLEANFLLHLARYPDLEQIQNGLPALHQAIKACHRQVQESRRAA